MTSTKYKQQIYVYSVALGSSQPSVFSSAALTLLAVFNWLQENLNANKEWVFSLQVRDFHKMPRLFLPRTGLLVLTDLQIYPGATRKQH